MTSLDKKIGARIRQRRDEIGLRLVDLATGLGVSIPQIHKYESGQNAVSPTAMLQLSALLGVSIIWFFADADEDTTSESELVALFRRLGKRARGTAVNLMKREVR